MSCKHFRKSHTQKQFIKNLIRKIPKQIIKNSFDLLEMTDDDFCRTSPSQSSSMPASSSKLQFTSQLDRFTIIRLVLLALLVIMLIGMLTTSLMLALHGKRRSDNFESLPSSFELKHTRISNLSICLSVFKISDENGACLVHTGKDFYGADEMCTSHGMDLLEINTDDEKFKIYEETQKLFGSGGGTRIWINGKWSSSEGAWLSHPSNKRFFLTSEHVELMSWRATETDGQCLAVESTRREKYHIGSCECSGQHYFYCEYQ